MFFVPPTTKFIEALLRKNKMKKKFYRERNLRQLENEGELYSKHVAAMTEEGLHKKTDIAAELAFRDSIIQVQEKQIKELLIEVKQRRGMNDSV